MKNEFDDSGVRRAQCLQHFLLTRFNARIPWLNRPAPDESWLEHRFRLFETFCFPSVAAQTNQNFTWLVFFDYKTPDRFRARLDRYAGLNAFQPCFLESFELPSICEMVRSHLKRSTQWVITTRLDNDDAISRQYLERIQHAVQAMQPSGLLFLNFRCGYYWWNNRVYLKEDGSNPFFSLVEERNDITTGFAYDHSRLKEYGQVRQVCSGREYIQVIHERNVSCHLPKLKKRVFKNALRDRFPLAVLEAGDNPIRVFVENLPYYLRRSKQVLRSLRW